MSRKSKIGLVLSIFVVLIVAARIAAEHYVLVYVNKTLDELDGYHGHVDDIDLHIYRGAYQAQNIVIEKEGKDDHKRTPFIAIDNVDLSVQWAALFDGAIVGEIELLHPVVNFVAEKKDKTPKPKEPSNWREKVDDLMPLKINHIGIKDGEIHYRDPHSQPKVDVSMSKFTGRLSNLTNSEDLSESLAATAHFTGEAMESAQFALDGKIDPYAKQPTFHITSELEKLEIKKFNDFLRAYGNIDAEQGLFSVYTEIDAKNGGFDGYVKPFVKDLKVMNWKDDEGGVVKKAWETLVQGAVKLLENDPKDQVASRVPLKGRIENPEADIGTTVLTLLRNAFIQALQAGLDTGLGRDKKQGIDVDKDGEQDQESAKKDDDKKEDKKDDKDKKADKGKKSDDKDGDKRLSRRDSKRD